MVPSLFSQCPLTLWVAPLAHHSHWHKGSQRHIQRRPWQGHIFFTCLWPSVFLTNSPFELEPRMPGFFLLFIEKICVHKQYVLLMYVLNEWAQPVPLYAWGPIDLRKMRTIQTENVTFFTNQKIKLHKALDWWGFWQRTYLSSRGSPTGLPTMLGSLFSRTRLWQTLPWLIPLSPSNT
jgi:hypothetical protein